MKKALCIILSLLTVVTLAFGTVGCGIKTSIFSRPTVEKVAGQKKNWNDVDSFTCYYGPLTGYAEKDPVLGGEPAPILETLKKFDVAIIHSSSLFSEGEAKNIVKELQDSGTYVIAYISIGEETGPKKGDALGGETASYYIYENGQPKMNGSWGSFFVDAGNPVWQQIVLQNAGLILDYGVDGLFLDTIDTVDVAYDTIGGMVELIQKLDEAYPEAKLVANRGFTVFPYVSQYLDGIMFESFTTTYDAESGLFFSRNKEEKEYNETVACNVINRARRYDYMPVFCLDYVNRDEYEGYSDIICSDVWQYDFLCYVTYSRKLEVCPYKKMKITTQRGSLALSKLKDNNIKQEDNGDTSSANLAYAGNNLCKVTVDSTFQGYSGARPLNDGFCATKENHNQDNWATEAWASKNDMSLDHWVQFEFENPQDITEVIVHWAVDNGTVFSPREAYVEAWVAGEWRRVASYNWKKDDGTYLVQQENTKFNFDKVTTTKLRVFQPKNKGDGTTGRTDGQDTVFSGIMWVSEIIIH